MLHLVKTNNLIVRRTPLVCGLLFAAALALLPISAAAQCSTGWDASGEWSMMQRGQKWPNHLVLQQKGRVLTGRAFYNYVTGDRKFLGVTTVGGDPVSVDGTVDGTIDGNSFSIQIFWANRQIGVYNGKVLASGKLDGEAWEKSSPQSRTIWHSTGVLKCPPPPRRAKADQVLGQGKAGIDTRTSTPPFISREPGNNSYALSSLGNRIPGMGWRARIIRT